MVEAVKCSNADTAQCIPTTHCEAEFCKMMALVAQNIDSAVVIADAFGQVKWMNAACTQLIGHSTLWESADLLASDRLDLWALMQRCWGRQEEQAMARKLTVRLINRLPDGITPIVYASEFWLTKVISESLGAALRAVPTGGTLDIELRPMGPRLLVVFRNSGMWPMSREDATLLSDPNAKPTPTSKFGKPAPTANAKDLLGLHLCQCILSLHGGQLRQEDEDGLRNFLIDLPIGAPYRQEDAAIDAAQAQRYAADLAALMARRHRKG